jgi:hypothetical protein
MLPLPGVNRLCGRQPLWRGIGLALAASMLGLVCLVPGCDRRDAAPVRDADASPGTAPQLSQAEANSQNEEAGRAAQELPGQGVPRFELQMTAADLTALENDSFSNNTHPATFKAEGKVYAGPGRARGPRNPSRSCSIMGRRLKDTAVSI